MRPVVAVTGATGRLAGEAVLSWLGAGAEVVALLRSDGGARAVARRAHLVGRIAALGPAAASRFSVVTADIAIEDLGPGERERRAVQRRVTHVVHAAASTALAGSAETSERVNVRGTAAALAFARSCPSLERFVHVSTAYVAGTRAGVVLETDAMGTSFRNPYESSKARAEALVAASGVAAIVVRPSIVVAARATPGAAPTAFEVAIERVLRRPGVPIAGAGDAPLDVVPAPYAARGLAHLALDERASSGAFHLVCGDRALTARDVVAIAAAARGVEPPPFRRDADGLADGALRAALDYLGVPARFDDRRARDVLDRHGVARPDPAEFLQRVFSPDEPARLARAS